MPPAIDLSGEILVVDDDPGSLHLLTCLLGDAGYHVDTAASGEMAYWQSRYMPPTWSCSTCGCPA